MSRSKSMMPGGGGYQAGLLCGCVWKNGVLVSGYQVDNSNKSMKYSQVRKHRGLPR